MANSAHYWTIPDDQVVRIQNRISDIRECGVENPLDFIAATYELLGTLETILFDQRNYDKTKQPKYDAMIYYNEVCNDGK